MDAAFDVDCYKLGKGVQLLEVRFFTVLLMCVHSRRVRWSVW